MTFGATVALALSRGFGEQHEGKRGHALATDSAAQCDEFRRQVCWRDISRRNKRPGRQPGREFQIAAGLAR